MPKVPQGGLQTPRGRAPGPTARGVTTAQLCSAMWALGSVLGLGGLVRRLGLLPRAVAEQRPGSSGLGRWDQEKLAPTTLPHPNSLRSMCDPCTPQDLLGDR